MKAVAMMLAALWIGSAAHAATILDGGFETPVIAGNFDTLNVGGNLGAWDITAGSVDLIRDYWAPSEGNQSIDLNGLALATISQTITGLTIGAAYEILFDMAGNDDGLPTIKSLVASIGATSGTYTFDTTGTSNTNMGWKTMALSFVADSTDMLLSFQSTSSAPDAFNAFGPALDNVRIAEVPLPAGGLLLLGALGGLAALRRRKSA